ERTSDLGVVLVVGSLLGSAALGGVMSRRFVFDLAWVPATESEVYVAQVSQGQTSTPLKVSSGGCPYGGPLCLLR
ncbi:hypothetical protein KI387_017767, partial [Taxus chinensis]